LEDTNRIIQYIHPLFRFLPIDCFLLFTQKGLK
jgi:hypothetical protein